MPFTKSDSSKNKPINIHKPPKEYPDILNPNIPVDLHFNENDLKTFNPNQSWALHPDDNSRKPQLDFTHLYDYQVRKENMMKLEKSILSQEKAIEDNKEKFYTLPKSKKSIADLFEMERHRFSEKGKVAENSMMIERVKSSIIWERIPAELHPSTSKKSSNSGNKLTKRTKKFKPNLSNSTKNRLNDNNDQSYLSERLNNLAANDSDNNNDDGSDSSEVDPDNEILSDASRSSEDLDMEEFDNGDAYEEQGFSGGDD